MIMIIRYSIDKWISQTVNMYYSKNLVLISEVSLQFYKKSKFVMVKK